jgi:putative SOS response-associated peptidase YedK
MCNRYRQAPREKIDAYGLLSVPTPFPTGEVFPRGTGSFVRTRPDSGVRELVIGQWGLVPHFAKTRLLTYSTNNARFEGVKTAASFKLSWSRGQRCIIPAEVFWEPCWESGRNEWWAFRRADGKPWSLAGLWNTWIDRATGEVVESYTMLTQNADHHPLMRRMHRPDPKLLPDQQDKRSVVALEEGDFECWLHGAIEDAERLIRLTPAECFDAYVDQREGAR